MTGEDTPTETSRHHRRLARRVRIRTAHASEDPGRLVFSRRNRRSSLYGRRPKLRRYRDDMPSLMGAITAGGEWWPCDWEEMSDELLDTLGLPSRGVLPYLTRAERDELLADALARQYASYNDHYARSERAFFAGPPPTAEEMPLMRFFRRCDWTFRAFRDLAEATAVDQPPAPMTATAEATSRPWDLPPEPPPNRLHRLTFTRAILTAAPPVRASRQEPRAAVPSAA